MNRTLPICCWCLPAVSPLSRFRALFSLSLFAPASPVPFPELLLSISSLCVPLSISLSCSLPVFLPFSVSLSFCVHASISVSPRLLCSSVVLYLYLCLFSATSAFASICVVLSLNVVGVSTLSLSPCIFVSMSLSVAACVCSSLSQSLSLLLFPSLPLSVSLFVCLGPSLSLFPSPSVCVSATTLVSLPLSVSFCLRSPLRVFIIFSQFGRPLTVPPPPAVCSLHSSSLHSPADSRAAPLLQKMNPKPPKALNPKP